MSTLLRLILLLTVGIALCRAAAFTQGNIIVAQHAAVVNGNNNAKSIDIVEYTTTGTYVQTLTLPTSTSPYGYRCTLGGKTVEGRLSISPDRATVGIGCFDANVGVSDPSAPPPGVIQRVSTYFGQAGSVTLQHGWGGEILTYILSAVMTKDRMYTSGHTDVLSADANGNNQFKMATIPGGNQYARTLKVFGPNLYIHDSIRFWQVGSGLPSSGTSLTLFLTAGTYAADFHMFDLSSSVKGYDTLYYVDNTAGTLNKYSYDGSSWTFQGSTSIASPIALTGALDGDGKPVLYVATLNNLVQFNDLVQWGVFVTGGEFCGISMAPHALCSDGSKTSSIQESDVDCGGNVCEKCPNGKACNVDLDCMENTCSNNVCVTPCTDGIKNWEETDVDCGGNNCRSLATCAVGKQCKTGSDCTSLSCSSGVCVAPTCSDGIKNQDETDVDCGGATCSVCNNGKSCSKNSDCLSLKCTSNSCEATGCSDGAMNGDETDIDCGGSCNKCALNQACSLDTDCGINNCVGSVCLAPTCSDSKQNQDETDVDCGGSKCNKCAPLKNCAVNSDCSSLNCFQGKCSPPTCDDGILNQDETDVDCGGSCSACANNQGCSLNTDCVSKKCVNSKCAAPTCVDSVKNQDETDVDCGGSTCNKCANTKTCGVNNDCTSLHCVSSVCVAAACSDNIKNQGESDVDCGGPNCAKCAANRYCGTGNDCQSGVCNIAKICALPTCNDGVKNQDETDVDCGGAVCGSCANTKRCLVGQDCTSRNCKNTVCVAPTCFDTIQNQNEPDVDCGGVCTVKCLATKSCGANSDCKSNVCTNSVCQATCSDGEKNQNETDVDCGGSCNKCPAGNTCATAGDCMTGVCTNGVCTQACSDSVKNNGETDVDCGGPLCSACSVGKVCTKNIDCASNFCNNSVCATPVVPVAPFQCNCNDPTPFCDEGLQSCVGLRIVPIVQCVEIDGDSQYVAYMAYNNQASSSVTLDNSVNFVNVVTASPPSVYLTGRPHIYPQSAFNIVSGNAMTVMWYADGFNLTFDIADQQLLCPADVSFYMTSSATVEQLISISSSIIGNLSEIMNVARDRLNVTFSASTKRQVTSVIIVVVKAGDGASSSSVVKDFLENKSGALSELVPEAAVASVQVQPLANEQSGTNPVGNPTSTPVASPVVPNAPTGRTIVSGSNALVACSALLSVGVLLL